MHAKEIKAVKLLMFASTPFGPSAEFHQLVAGEFSKGTFLRGGGSSLEGLEELIDGIDQEVINIVIIDKNGMDGT
jgi:hypothetical protein